MGAGIKQNLRKTKRVFEEAVSRCPCQFQARVACLILEPRTALLFCTLDCPYFSCYVCIGKPYPNPEVSGNPSGAVGGMDKASHRRW